MSRCYPFLPPGYARNETRDESLIKGTKKKVKRDRKHNKDKKRKERDNEAEHQSKKHPHKRRRRKDESVNASKKVADGRGLVANNELEYLEKSCLTVELEQQTSSQSSCDSRANHIQSPLLLDGRQYGFETDIWILLHAKEHEYHDDEVMITNKNQKKYSSQESLDASQTAPSEFIAHTPANVCQEKRREISTKFSKDKKIVPLESHKQIRTPLGKEKSHSHQETVGASKLCSICPSSTALRFLNLIESWAPDRVESKLTDSEDHELWFSVKIGTKRHHHQVSNHTTINGSSS